MLPVFESFTLYALLMDLAYAAAFLMFAQFLRKKIKILQDLYIPASLMAGIFGLLCGPQFLNIVHYSPVVSSYASMLVILLFATLTLGYKGKSTGSALQRVVGVKDTFFTHITAGFAQFGLATILGVVLVKLFWPEMNPAVGMLAPAGFAGGHGTAATVGQIFEEAGFEGATGIGITFATLGLLCGIIIGMININIAIRLGSTKHTKKMSEIPAEMRTGWVPEGKRGNMGEATMSPSSIDPSGWHWCIVFLCGGIGYVLNLRIPAVAGVKLPAMCYAALVGLVFQTLMNKAGVGSYVDKTGINRVGGTVTDFLVFFGTASLNVSVVLDYIGPIVLLSLFCILWTLFVLWILGPMMFTKGWFERSIYIYGMMNGVIATGVTLLRVIDPDSESGTLEDYGIAYAPMSWQNMVQQGVMPVMAANGAALSAGLLGTGIAAVTFVISCLTHTTHPWKKKYLNSAEFEAEMIAKGYQKKD